VQAIRQIVDKKQNQLVMLKSWNEWGEGNYIEPDKRWGQQYLDVLREQNCK
ncbi:MAG: glycoside hydrolase family 99-like domain-containing protein, partial [Paludibacteraceae bacterium]|nr:glycoside hydrolase family 99-like domain-containing protein [Paludibacteraceae bacterium]